MSGRVLGLDVGTRRIGVAVSDPTKTIATPLYTLERRGLKEDLEHLRVLCETEDVESIIVGWPLETSGRQGGIARIVQGFIDELETTTRLPVFKWDERLTSVAAERALTASGVRGQRRKQLVDQVAAAIILQGWLDRLEQDLGNGQ